MWAIGVPSVLLIVYGAYTYYDADQEYQKLDDERVRISENIDEYRDKQMLLVAKHKDLKAAERRRDGSVLYVGVGMIALAVAYFVAPEGSPKPKLDEGDEENGIPTDEVPSFVADEISSDQSD